MLALSGKSEEALKELARRYLACLDEEAEVDLGDLCYTAGIGRSHFSHRAALVVESVDGLRAGLAALAEGQAADGLVQGLSSAPPKIAFLFTGQGSQYLGMGRELYEREPLVRALLDRCDGVIRELRGVSLLAVMFEGEGGSLGRHPMDAAGALCPGGSAGGALPRSRHRSLGWSWVTRWASTPRPMRPACSAWRRACG